MVDVYMRLVGLIFYSRTRYKLIFPGKIFLLFLVSSRLYVLCPPPVRPNATVVLSLSLSLPLPLSLSLSLSGVTPFVDFISDGYMLFKYMGAKSFLTGKISCKPHSY
jgi:hypothetical protein